MNLTSKKGDAPAKDGSLVLPQESSHSSEIPIALEAIPETPPDKLTLEELYDDWDTPIPESLDEVVQVCESTVRIFSSLIHIRLSLTQKCNRSLALEEDFLHYVTFPNIPTSASTLAYQ